MKIQSKTYEDIVIDVIHQLQNYDVEKVFKIADQHHDIKKFRDGYLDIYSLCMMMDTDELDQSVHKFMMGIAFIKYNLIKQQKNHRSYIYGHITCLSMCEEIVNYYKKELTK